MKTTISFRDFQDDAARWHAVQSRDATADGLFVYAVKSTKIYCRPICKARLPRRQNVSFYATWAQAEGGGFRACKRCKPSLQGAMPADEAVHKIWAFIEANVKGAVPENDMRMSLGQMAKQTGLSKWHFHRLFKSCVGMTPVQYTRMQRGLIPCETPVAGSRTSQQGDSDDTDSAAAMEQTHSNVLFLEDFVCWPEDEFGTELPPV
jgi:methylphosphotriester-DNA--protein-cysteine methyltransferase